MNDQNNSVITALVVALVASIAVVALAFTFFMPKAAPAVTQQAPAGETTDVGGLSLPTHNTPEIWTTGLGFGLDYLTFSKNGVIGAGSNQASWRNDTARTVYIDLAELIPGANASSTMKVSIGTSTAATISNNYAAPYATLVDNYTWATSTGATLVINSMKDAGTNGRYVIPVAAGEYVNILFRIQNSTCNGSICEAATSTNRGFTNVNWYLRGHYKP